MRRKVAKNDKLCCGEKVIFFTCHRDQILIVRPDSIFALNEKMVQKLLSQLCLISFDKKLKYGPLCMQRRKDGVLGIQLSTTMGSYETMKLVDFKFNRRLFAVLKRISGVALHCKAAFLANDFCQKLSREFFSLFTANRWMSREMAVVVN